MKLIRLVIWVCVSAGIVNVMADTLFVSGTVTDSITGNVLSGVTVTARTGNGMTGLTATATSNSLGFYQIVLPYDTNRSV